MRKFYYFLIILIIAVSFAACSQKSATTDESVLFYYVNTELSYNTADGVISPEVRDDYKLTDPFETLIIQYFQGPSSDNHVSLMPKGTAMTQYIQADGIFKIYLNENFSELKGMDQTLAGACLAKTVTGLTGTVCVEIYTEGAQNDSPIMVFDQANLLLIDDSHSY